VGYHDAREIPNYWDYAKNFVLQDHMFEPTASWSLPEPLFQVSELVGPLHRSRQPEQLRERPAEPGNPPDFAARPQRAASPALRTIAWTDLTYLLHRDKVNWGYYVVSGNRARLRERRRHLVRAARPESEDAGNLEPLAVLRHGQGRQPAGQHPVGGWLLPGRPDGRPPGCLLGRAQRCRQRAPARPGLRRPVVRHQTSSTL